jgi:quercetin dioxygenase-like cupin family protein
MSASLESLFSYVAETSPQRIWDGVVGRARHGSELTLAVVELDAGTVIPEHSHVNEQIGLLIEGTVTFRIGDEERAVDPGASWCIPAHAAHEIRVGADGAVIVEAFAPPRDDWRGLEQIDAPAPRWPR